MHRKGNRMSTERQEHLDFCKLRALEYCELNQLSQALASMVSDLRSNLLTKDHCAIEIGLNLSFAGQLNTREELIAWIKGFN